MEGTRANVAAVVVAGGSSRRMGFDKLRAVLGGSPVYLHCLRTLQECREIRQIILVASGENFAEFRTATVGFPKLTDVIAGGAERHFSVAAGLERVAPDCEFVAVHDAARPLLSARDLHSVLAAAREHGAASLASPVADTLKQADAENFVSAGVDRRQLWSMQTPQVFRVERLRAAYAALLARDELVTDEVSAVAKQGDRVKLVPAQDFNFKITYSCDIALARLALLPRDEASREAS